ncbi:MAG: hydroxysqualene dehydroxylase HpnE [Burkholderiaceae bacterium]|nr:hydroxysqualene dehydroxylase HpnE [Burkholderiaceae bacterium]
MRAAASIQNKTGKRVAVIGAGWAGCTAATRLAESGCAVTLIEASRNLGGRARRIEVHGHALDNGQHILLGAYSEALSLMKTLSIDTNAALLNLPLQMIYPPHTNGMHFLAPRWPAPLHLLLALLRADGLTRADKLALARFSSAARWMGWQLHNDCSVSELLERFDQTERLCQLMWHPLCLAALNTPPERASAKIFLNVLRDSLGAKRAASDMLLPRVDLSALLPEAAAQYIQQRGGTLIQGLSVQHLRQTTAKHWQLEGNRPDSALAGDWDAVIIATPLAQARTLLQQAEFAGTFAPTLERFANFDYEAITTCYLQYAPELKLPRAFYALLDQVAEREWGQFVFDRGQLNPQQAGLMAVVISASAYLNQSSHAELAHDLAQQLAKNFNDATFTHPIWHQIITEKRATFACTPNLQRPANDIGVPGLLIAGDYTAGDYPATLEAAVRSGAQAARLATTWLNSKDEFT